MSEIKYGNMPASVVEEIRLASKSKYPNSTGNGIGFSHFMEDFLPILAKLWPEDSKKIQSAKDKELRDLRAELERLKHSQTPTKMTQENIHVAETETASCTLSLKEAVAEFNQFVDSFWGTPEAFFMQARAFFIAKGYNLVEIVDLAGGMLLFFQTKR